MSKNSGPDVSPGTPDHLNNNLKSRTSTPVPGNRRIPLSNGRTPPSKWDDAERWIKSPVSGKAPGGGRRQQIKSKSGPLGGPGVLHSSPSTPKVERSFVEELPRGPGALVPRELFTNNGVVRKNRSLDGESNLMPDSSDEKLENAPKEDDPAPSKTNDRTNQPTQMAHKESSKENLSFDNKNGTKDKVWDIQIDKSITSKHKLPKGQEPSETIKMCNASSSENAPDASKNISKSQSKEVEKITNWENLQKAKAEKAIRKLEMKLEKKRSTSTEKIMNKLKESQRKAEAMRSTVVSENDYSQKTRIATRGWGFSCFNAKACSTCDCFITTCGKKKN